MIESGESFVIAAALFAVLAGVALLRFGWRKKGRVHATAVTSGWIAIGLSILPFSAAFGAELGAVHTALWASVAGLAAVALNLEFRERRSRKVPEAGTGDPWTARRIGRGLLRGVGASVLTGVASSGVGIWFAAWVPVDSPQVVVFVGFAIWLVWAGLAVWVLTTPRPALLCAGLVVVSLVAFGASGIV